jgi:predicted tellurium resistance membrane protein TerC
MEWLTDPHAWIGLLTLTVLELVLGIDNIVFISILSGKLPAHQQKKARLIGLSMAMLMRILLLLSITWIARLTHPLCRWRLRSHRPRHYSGRRRIISSGEKHARNSRPH